MTKDDLKEYFIEVIDIVAEDKLSISQGLIHDLSTFKHNTDTNEVGSDFKMNIKPVVDLHYERKIDVLKELQYSIGHFMDANNSEYVFDINIDICFKKKV